MSTVQIATGAPITTRPLKIGLYLPTLEGSLNGATARWTDVLAMAQQAEAVGFDSLWVADHFLFLGSEIVNQVPGVAPFDSTDEKPSGAWEVWSLIAALAAAVPRVELGTLIVCTSYRNPALLAKMVDTVDEISGGRLILGLGAGDSLFEHRAFGYPDDHRVGRFEEALTIIHTLLRTGVCDFAGTYYQVHECELRPRGLRLQGPPFMIGALGPGKRMLRLTAQYADMWNVWLAFTRSHPDVLPQLRSVVDAACLKYERNPTTLARTVTVRVAVLGEQVSGAIAGSPDDIAAALAAFAREGVSHIQVWLAPNTLAGLEAFAPVLERLDQLSSRCEPHSWFI
jgi:alkanesulfonate monooxygenase SsuD/methylene tetrahydromethanopterin reductase-like flavin-dependent oxidoreductase (luciferase family)